MVTDRPVWQKSSVEWGVGCRRHLGQTIMGLACIEENLSEGVFPFSLFVPSDLYVVRSVSLRVDVQMVEF